MRRILVLPLIAALASACDGDPEGVDDRCMTGSLPLTGASAGPTITDVGLEVQATGIVVVVTATDPQGSDDLLDIVQSVSVFPDADCSGSPITIRDDLAGSGVEETFGTVVEASDSPALYESIANADGWPVELDFMDRSANRTTGRVMARIIR